MTWGEGTRYVQTRFGKEEHILIAEKAFGGLLPKGTQVHHVDGNGENNRNDNLVICPNQKYHFLLHIRTRALEACGNPNWRKCAYCHKWDEPQNLYIWGDGHICHHRKCNTNAVRKYKLKKG